MNEQLRLPLVGAAGIESFREGGYKNTAHATAELVDNSIQANAKNVGIYLFFSTRNGRQYVDNIIVADDGDGMDLKTFEKALTFASGTRLGNTRGLGRYGMGLPNSSVSQTKLFKVYTWQTSNGTKQTLYNYMDLDEIRETNDPYLKFPEHNPEHIRGGKLDIIDTLNADNGTIVIWENPDRIKPLTVRPLVSHLDKHLSRMFRYYITGFQDNGTEKKTNIIIKMIDYNGQSYSQTNNDHKVKPFDPLFIMEDTQTIETFPDEEFNGVTSTTHAVVDKSFTEGDDDHPIKIIFTHFKKEVRDNLGPNPGSTELGKKYLMRNNPPTKSYANISIVRAKREIDNGQYGFILDVSDPTVRFFSVEIQFEPISDRIFGVDNSKQAVNRFHNHNLDDEDTFAEMDFNTKTLTEISQIISANIKDMKSQLRADAAGRRRGTQEPGEDNGIVVDPIPVDGTGEENEGDPITDEIKDETKAWLLNRFSDELGNNETLLQTNVDWFLGLPCKHYIIYSDLGDIELYSFKTFGDKTLIEININHQFYGQFITDIEEKDDVNTRNIIWFLISSLVLSEKKYIGSPNEIILKNIRATLATNLSELMDNWYS